MLSFRLHHLEISGKHYLLLPKLNDRQMGILAGRLERKGFSVRRAPSIIARSAGGTIHVDPTGLCWAHSDPEDVLLPAIPELLSCPKQVVPLRTMKGLYLRSNGPSAKIITRVESGPAWAVLRAAGECGLAPDERLVALALLGGARTCRLLTDYTGEGPGYHTFGRRWYFEMAVTRDEAETTLRTAGELHTRNSYLPRDGDLGPVEGCLPELEDAFSELGEWCYFTPQLRESSNCRLRRLRSAPVV